MEHILEFEGTILVSHHFFRALLSTSKYFFRRQNLVFAKIHAQSNSVKSLAYTKRCTKMKQMVSIIHMFSVLNVGYRMFFHDRARGEAEFEIMRKTFYNVGYNMVWLLTYFQIFIKTESSSFSESLNIKNNFPQLDDYRPHFSPH